jgi:hypothetical protein
VVEEASNSISMKEKVRNGRARTLVCCEKREESSHLDGTLRPATILGRSKSTETDMYSNIVVGFRMIPASDGGNLCTGSWISTNKQTNNNCLPCPSEIVEFEVRYRLYPTVPPSHLM